MDLVQTFWRKEAAEADKEVHACSLLSNMQIISPRCKVTPKTLENLYERKECGNCLGYKELFNWMQVGWLYAWIYRVFSAQADWTLTHTSHKDTEHSTIEASITLDGVTRTNSLLIWTPDEWPSVCREIPVSADKMFSTSNKPVKWTFYTLCLLFRISTILCN
jgi:hypothetical protein